MGYDGFMKTNKIFTTLISVIYVLSTMSVSTAHAGVFDFLYPKKAKATPVVVVEKTKEPEEEKTIADYMESKCADYPSHHVRLACHEAGHLVLCLASNKPVLSAFIDPEALDIFEEGRKDPEKNKTQQAPKLGRVLHSLSSPVITCVVQRQEIIVEYAGHVVEVLAFPGTAPYFADSDLKRVDTWIVAFLKRWDVSGKERKQHLKKIENAARDEFKQLCFADTASLLEDNKELLSACVDALLTQHTLQSQDIAQIISQQ